MGGGGEGGGGEGGGGVGLRSRVQSNPLLTQNFSFYRIIFETLINFRYRTYPKYSHPFLFIFLFFFS